MANDSSDTVLERNVGRMVRRWADPVMPNQIEQALGKFLRELSRPTADSSPRRSLAGRLGIAAALLLGAVTFWAIFSPRTERLDPARTAAIPGLGQAGPDVDLQDLVSKLASASYEEQGWAAEALGRLGSRATPALERATGHPNPQVRDWAGKLLERLRKKAEGVSRSRMLELRFMLASDDFAVQGRAADELRNLGPGAIQPLKEMRTDEKNPRVIEWIDKLLGALNSKSTTPGPERPPREAQRPGPRYGQAAPGEGPQATESPVLGGLKWLARHQGRDGSWSADLFADQCQGGRCGGIGEKDYNAGLTALSLLAFGGAGYTPLSKDEYPDPANPGRTLQFGSVVSQGLAWLLSHQDPDGCIGGRGVKYMYNHAMAALCLSEAYGMSALERYRAPAQKAIDFLVAAQNEGKGWRYSSRSGDNDTSVTGWAVLALRSAEVASLRFPHSAYDGALRWLNQVSVPDGYFAAGYTARGSGKVFIPGRNERFDDHPTMSAIAVASRIFMKAPKTEPSLGSINLVIADLPEWRPDGIDLYYWHFGTLALYQYDGSEGPMWQKWNEAMKNALVPNQRTQKDGCRSGSWDPEVDRWGSEGGRIYTTALGTLTLEIYYRISRVWKEGK